MNKERQRKLAARARRMESLHSTSNIAIQANKETAPEVTKVKKIKKDVQPTKVKKTEKKQIANTTKKSKIKSGAIQKIEVKGVSKKKKHNSKVKGAK